EAAPSAAGAAAAAVAESIPGPSLPPASLLPAGAYPGRSQTPKTGKKAAGVPVWAAAAGGAALLGLAALFFMLTRESAADRFVREGFEEFDGAGGWKQVKDNIGKLPEEKKSSYRGGTPGF